MLVECFRSLFVQEIKLQLKFRFHILKLYQQNGGLCGRNNPSLSIVSGTL